MLISIIIPVYNVSNYLEVCLDSVVNQTYRDLQIIIVNDGSTDNSAEIAKSFADSDERIQLIHQENKGLSGARNTGLSYAKGEFVFYLDSDDYLTKNAIEILVKAAKEENSDIVQGNFYYDYPDYLMYANWFAGDKKHYNREETLMELIKQNEIKNFAWGKLIRTEIAKKHLFPEGLFFEDTLWMTKIGNDIQKYIVLKESVLYYRQRETGISGSFSLKNLDQLKLLDMRLEFIQKNQFRLYQLAKESFLTELLMHSKLCRNLSPVEKEKYLKEINYFLKKHQMEDAYNFQLNSRLIKFKYLLKKIKSKIFPDVKWIKECK